MLCTTRFHTKRPTFCSKNVHVLRKVIKKSNENVSMHINNRLLFVVERVCVNCTIGTEYLNINDVKLSLQRVKLRYNTAGSAPFQTLLLNAAKNIQISFKPQFYPC
jgi:hypothetical protein